MFMSIQISPLLCDDFFLSYFINSISSTQVNQTFNYIIDKGMFHGCRLMHGFR